MASGSSIPRSPEAGAAPFPDRILLVGNPNVGKSALFGRLTGTYVTVSNYPGTTVEVTRGTMVAGGRKCTVVDTPGTNSFLPTTDDERVTRDMLLEGDAGVVVIVGDAKNLERTVAIALQVAEMQIPAILCLNMMDEARSRGIGIDVKRLERATGFPVVPTVAVDGRGTGELVESLASPAVSSFRIEYPRPVEEAVARIAPLLPHTPVSSRSMALMFLGGDCPLHEWIRTRVAPETFEQIDRIRIELESRHAEPLTYILNQARLQHAGALATAAAHRPASRAAGGSGPASRLERLSVHPFWGIPILAAVLWLAYQFVGVFGAGTLVDLLESKLFGEWINPLAAAAVEKVFPWQWLRDLFVGEYGVITMALTYSLALVFPIVGTFFLAFGALEDSGYLPRLAVMVNRLFRKMGLNGKAVLPMVLGLGCDTMATLTTRILETRKERLIVIILLALGVPCSAQMTVILALMGSLSVAAMGIWLGVVLGVIFLVGRLAAWILPGENSDFVLELPPMRVPRIRNILVKTLARIEWYLKEAVPLFVLGTLILYVGDRLNLLGGLQKLCEPVLGGLLGLPPETAEAFVIGFLRRDFGAAGLYHMAQDGMLDAIQIVVAVVTITLFIPCIANLFMVVRERGLKTGLAIASFILPFALLVGAAVNWVLRALQVSL